MTDSTSSDDPGSANVKEDPLSLMWRAIWTRRPILKEIMDKRGDKTLYEYAGGFSDVNHNPVLDARKVEVVDTVKDLLTDLLGTKVANGVAKQLKDLPLVSTADHHGPIVSTFFLNANIISAISLMDSQLLDQDDKYLVVFSFSTVSVNNVSYPRGLLFHGDDHGTGDVVKLPILPDRDKMGVVYGMRPYTQADLDNAISTLDKLHKSGDVSESRFMEVKEVLKSYFGTSDMLDSVDFCSQVTRVNYKLWPKFFHPQPKKVPNMIYLDIETLVRELLVRYLFKDSKSLIFRLLFGKDSPELIYEYFNGINGAFSIEKGWGTYLFWALDSKNKRVVLDLSKDHKKLVSRDGLYEFDFTPDGLTEASRLKQIFPSMFLCYLVIALHYGFKCLGGFSQVNDLTRAKDAWGQILAKWGEQSEIDAISHVQTKELGGDGMILAYLKNAQDDLSPATGIDLLLDQGDTSFEKYVTLSKVVRFREIFDPLSPEIYKVLFSANERQPEFIELTPEKILESTGLKSRISPFFS
jgi:hypothetical protein